MKIASAAGKLMLFGEHAVVYGYPCIATAINWRLCVLCDRIKGERDVFRLSGSNDKRFVQTAVDFIRYTFGVKDKVLIQTSSDFKDDVGLGSSSAAVVATLWALKEEIGLNLSFQEVIEIGINIVRQVQGSGSGFDIATAVHGGTIYFQPSPPVVTPIDVGVLPLMVAFSGRKAATPRYLQQVARQYETRRSEMKEIFEKIAGLTKDAYKAILDDDMSHLGYLMTQNHLFLKRLGVSTKKLDLLVSAACSAGALGAKLSGAGGGDCIIAIVPESKRARVKKALEKTKGEVLDIIAPGEGVRLE